MIIIHILIANKLYYKGEVMDILFFLLFLVCFIAIIVGLIKPTAVIRWGNSDKRNRKKVLKFYGIGNLVSIFND